MIIRNKKKEKYKKEHCEIKRKLRHKWHLVKCPLVAAQCPVLKAKCDIVATKETGFKEQLFNIVLIQFLLVNLNIVGIGLPY